MRTSPTEQFTYPQFIAAPGGALQPRHRAGDSGDGRNGLAEYDGGRRRAAGEWAGSTGTYTSEHGSSTTRNRYLHGIDYSTDGTLHAFHTWREGNSRIAAASGWTDWTILFDARGLNAFGEVVLDETRLAQDGVLSFLYQERSTGTTPSPVHVIDFALPG